MAAAGMARRARPVHNPCVETSRPSLDRRRRRWLALALLAVLAGALTPGTARAAGAADSLLELAVGGTALGFGLGLSPLHRDAIEPTPPLPGGGPAERATLADLEADSRALSLDIKLRWPGAEARPLEPYLVFGPALFLERPYDIASLGLAGIPSDPVLRLGARAGAGFNWRLGKDTTVFGAYDLSTTDLGALGASGAREPAMSGGDGFDILYGVRFRY
jgi:hypothetical protein